jgi:hydroxymethylpyrimidine pyrophosphatase-like HAD family hydrolase
MQLSALTEFTHANTGFMTDEDASAFVKYVNENYGDKISAHQNGRAVDMPPVNTSKVTGIYQYASLFENPEIYAVGDNINDISMIEEFEGFAVENARDEVKASAKHQCKRICDMIDYLMGEK